MAISYFKNGSNFGKIEIFTGSPELDSIIHKVKEHSQFSSMEPLVYSRTAYRLTNLFHQDYPKAYQKLSKGHLFDMATNIFDRLPEAFSVKKPDLTDEYLSVVGRENGTRSKKYIKKIYVNNVDNIDYFKVFTPSGSDGASIMGGKPVMIFGPSFVAGPNDIATETFLGIGRFNSLNEAECLLKYLRSKFVRALVAVLKVTPNTTPEKFKYVPLQDFSSNSDIDWSVSIPEIDQQLYKKYGLSTEEIDFIETHVKEME